MYPQTWYKHITREWRKTKRKRKENWLLSEWDEQILANLTKWNIMSKKFSTFSCFWKSVDHDFFYYTFKQIKSVDHDIFHYNLFSPRYSSSIKKRIKDRNNIFDKKLHLRFLRRAQYVPGCLYFFFWQTVLLFG